MNKEKEEEKKTPTNNSTENNTKNTDREIVKIEEKKQCELIYGDARKSDKIYFACFSFEENENSCLVFFLCAALLIFVMM